MLKRIFCCLGPHESLFFGMTCTRAYDVHFKLHGPITDLMHSVPDRIFGTYFLYTLIYNWMGTDYIFCQNKEKFVLREKLTTSSCSCFRCQYTRDVMVAKLQRIQRLAIEQEGQAMNLDLMHNGYQNTSTVAK